MKRELLAFPQALFKFVDSSNLLTVSYYEKKQQLEIEFRSGGLYRYYHVPRFIYDELISAYSHGQYFWKWVRMGPFRYRRLR